MRLGLEGGAGPELVAVSAAGDQGPANGDWEARGDAAALQMLLTAFEGWLWPETHSSAHLLCDSFGLHILVAGRLR